MAYSGRLPARTLFGNPKNAVGYPVSRGDTVVNVKDFGAVADNGTTDNATAISAAYAVVVAKGGGVLYFPAGNWGATTFPTITQSGTRIVGEACGDPAASGTVLRQMAASGDFITFSGVKHCSVENVMFYPTQRLTSGYQINISASNRTMIEHVFMQYCFNGILFWNSSNVASLWNVDMRQMLGNRGINMTYLAAGTGAQGLFVRNFVGDNGYVFPGTLKTWATSTGFTQGDIIIQNNVAWNCAVTGTSASSGTGPTGLPAGTSPDSVFTTTVPDGSTSWFWCFPSDQAWITMDSYCGTLTIDGGVGLLDGGIGVHMVDTANTGSSFPTFLSTFDLECDHSLIAGVKLDGGISAMFSNLFCGGCLGGPGFWITAGYKGEVQICNSTIGGHWFSGIEIESGSIKTLIANNVITDNSHATSHTYNGVNIQANASYVQLTNNLIGKISDSQNAGIAMSGTSDHIIIAHNDVSGNFNASKILNTASGTHNVVEDNIGYNPVGTTAAANVGASPATITAGPSPETHYLNQSATNSATVTKGTRQVAALVNSSTYYPIHLGPNESYVVTWLTTQPTFTKDVH